jgi:CDP-diacylglycerol--serine O-phosphatidyltransferase
MSIKAQALLILLGMLFDFADGLAARLLKAQSELGKQLDSLADMITFGALPGLMLYRMIQGLTVDFSPLWMYIAWAYTLGAAWRLARFNAFDTEKSYFVGVPSPMAALVVASLPWAIPLGLQSEYIFLLIIFISISLGMLMVASIPLLSLKFKNLKWQENSFRYFLIFISLLLIVIWQFKAVPLILILYVGLSLLAKYEK